VGLVALTAVAGAGALAFGFSWGMLHFGFFGRYQIVDVGAYQAYGDAVMDGKVPYRDFHLGYPPFALPVFIVPSFASAAHYRGVFEFLMLQCGVAAVGFAALTLRAVGASLARIAVAVGFIALAPLVLGSVVLSRYDLWPAAITAAALAALVSGRPRLASGLLAVAVAAKFYAAVLLPLALVFVYRQRNGREALKALAVFVLVLAPLTIPFLFGGNGLADTSHDQATRALQIETLGSSILLAAHQLGAYAATVVSGPGSQNLAGDLPDMLATVSAAVQALAVVVVWVLYARGPATRERLLMASAAALAAFVAFGRVLSPQYLVWLVPVVPLVAGRLGLAAAGILTAALALTQAWFPQRYFDLVALQGETWLVLARNLVLVLLYGLLTIGLRARSGPTLMFRQPARGES
jgi:hypothetical protein